MNRSMMFLFTKLFLSAAIYDIIHGQILTDGIEPDKLTEPMLRSAINSSQVDRHDRNTDAKKIGLFKGSEDIDTLNMFYMFGYKSNLTNITRDNYNPDTDQLFRLNDDNVFDPEKKTVDDDWDYLSQVENKVKQVASRISFETKGSRSKESRYRNLVNSNKLQARRPFTFVRIERQVFDYSSFNDDPKEEETKDTSEADLAPLESEEIQTHPWSQIRNKRKAHQPHHFRIGHSRKTTQKPTPSNNNHTRFV